MPKPPVQPLADDSVEEVLARARLGDAAASSALELQRRLAFERCITSASAALMRSDGGALDQVVVEVLGSIGRFFKVDRAYLFEIDQTAGHQSNTHEWVAPGISAEAQNLQQIPLTVFPWLLAGLRDDQTISLPDITALPAEAVNERAEFEREGAQMLGSALQARAMSRRLEALAFHDSLTGLPNRKLLQDRLESALVRVRRQGRGLLVAMVDLDDFKRINDQYGHAAGDAVLCETARRLVQALRPIDTVARLGGDEFVLVIEEETDEVAPEQVGQRLLAAFSPEFEVEGLHLQQHLSVGMVLVDPAVDDADRLLRRADAAMYRAKAGGKNRWVCDPER
ncbi:MAG: diguanylate cyclase [Gammaproteobacteria bacterium]|nr:diguanylate cyclase [Gammaproteobacteria bacterium]